MNIVTQDYKFTDKLGIDTNLLVHIAPYDASNALLHFRCVANVC